jgi:N-methylhydantoinase A/oxoprolinase/acetone carboxylase beta subunit
MTRSKSKTQNLPALVLGIDTGGTYTDGVLLDYDTRRVLASHKSLTTKRDLALGIDAVIEGIQIEDPAAIKMVSISTTLATNAIAEGKGKPVALLLIGYDPELVASFKLDRQFVTPHHYYFAGGHDLYGQEKEPLDLPAILEKVHRLKEQVDAIAVSAYFSPLNPEHENRTLAAIAEVCDLPVVLGHQLSVKLGSIERATTAALNASLLAVLQEFIMAVRRSMKQRQINAPLMVVRGDGTLMSAEFAARTPVETIHSGPAASAMGGRFLSKLENGLVIDVGGTTTDIALIQAGQVAVSEAGARVNGYKTSVQAANLLSIALGGDSHISLNRERHLTIGPERVMPLAHLAAQHPQVRQQLKLLLRRSWNQTSPDWLEYWFLLRQPPEQGRLTRLPQQALVELLSHGPQPLPEILKQLKVMHISQVDTGHLLRREIIGKAGLTPTDLLHLEGSFAAWDVEAASLALESFSRFLGCPPQEIQRQVWTGITGVLVEAVVTFLSEKTLAPASSHAHDLGRWFLQNSLQPSHPHLETHFRLRHPIIGIGAPAQFFLQEAAKLLHTELVLPAYYPVANAVGAIAGNVVVTEDILVYPRLSDGGLAVTGFFVQAGNERDLFNEIEVDHALGHARAVGRERALAAARQAGAANPQVLLEEHTDGLDTYHIRVKALGNPRLAR